jgi:hypothetical protein
VLQRFSEIVGALPQLGEQPRVLDSDYGLRGEILNQRDLLVGKGATRYTLNAPISSFSFSIGISRRVRMPPSSTAATLLGSRCAT